MHTVFSLARLGQVRSSQAITLFCGALVSEATAED